ncbi:dextranase [Pustulibacterium marinum]|uniref:Dextranase n=1 Tax=Pustulibacterium marinum TaxID=1224947 RepID=A0A1I7H6Q3_9FLAO|nr:glycoside hydrolase family 66 protein [Pustulibacterium marinum]SFU56387.1 dextranase [Pustulibacterium marinum]
MLMTLVVLSACKDDDINLSMSNQGDAPQENTFQEVGLQTDKARYNPGDIVTFSVPELSGDATVIYKYCGEVISQSTVTSSSWTWTPPNIDFKGYEVSLWSGNTLVGTTAVDVSSDWTRFPRYGFLSNFGAISDAEQHQILNNLKNYHINGLQYYDWHWKHHIPLPMDETTGMPATSWEDLFNRTMYFQTIENYIDQGHEYHMAAMFYNLIFGVWHESPEENVSPSWYAYKDRFHTEKDGHALGDFGTIYLTDPNKEGWHDYIFNQTQYVYNQLDFDGWHLDQLGDRGVLYDYGGYQIDLSQGYESFLNALYQEFPSKAMVLNAVDQFGQSDILETPVNFAYTEVWSAEQYADLAQIIVDNYESSDEQLNTVLAAYMNYDMESGSFNTPAVLLTDAVIFAFGGAHLELGEHMLSREYFPYNNLQVEAELSSGLQEYYDFLVAYENLLRDGGTFQQAIVTSLNSDISVNSWPPVFGQTAVLAKSVENKQVFHLLNFNGVNSLQWRDNEQSQTEPLVKNNIKLSFETTQAVSKVWFASPDYLGGASQSLEFIKDGNQVTVTIPYLKYWSMLVFE